MTIERAAAGGATQLDRVLVLIEQGRLDLAEPQVRQFLGEDPDNAGAHAVLAMCLSEAKLHREAIGEAKTAVSLAPDMAHAHYVLAGVLVEADRADQAAAAIKEALRLDPSEPNHYVMLAAVKLNQGRYREALDAAHAALARDPENVEALNMRQTALTALNRQPEAIAAASVALERDPEDALAHSNRGWLLLQRREPSAAVEAFGESLRLDPANERARYGLVEAMKARNPVYGLILRYFLFVGRLSPGKQLAVLGLLYFVSRVPLNIAKRNTDLAPFMMPLIVAYVIFVWTSWFASPLSNMLLQLDPVGRLALSERERRETKVIGGLLGLGLATAALGLLTRDVPLFLAALSCAVICLPVIAAFHSRAGWPRTTMAALAVASGVLVAAGTIIAIVAELSGLFDFRFGLAPAVAGLLIAFLSSWLGGILGALRPTSR